MTASIYTTIYPLLFHIAFRVTGNAADADDAVHDAFLAVLKMPTPPTCVRAYLSASARNRAISRLRERRKAVRLVEGMISHNSTVEAGSPRPQVNLALYAKSAGGDKRLPTVWREIAAGRKYREIGADIGMSVNAIKALVWRSRKRLKELARAGGAIWS